MITLFQHQESVATCAWALLVVTNAAAVLENVIVQEERLKNLAVPSKSEFNI